MPRLSSISVLNYSALVRLNLQWLPAYEQYIDLTQQLLDSFASASSTLSCGNFGGQMHGL